MVDYAQRPLPGVFVTIRGPSITQPLRLVTAADGVARGRVAPGRVDVVVESSYPGPGETRAVDLEPGSHASLRLVLALDLVVRVDAPGGAPLPDASVHAYVDGAAPEASPVTLATGIARVPAHAGIARDDGAVVALVQHARYPPKRFEFVPEIARTPMAVLAMEDGALVDLQFVTDAGQPIREAVRFHLGGPIGLDASSAPDGSARLGPLLCRPGYRLESDDARFEVVAPEAFDVPAAGPIRVALRRLHAVEVVVRSADGGPIAGALVSFRERVAAGGTRSVVRRTDDGGTVRYGRRDGEPLAVRVSHGGRVVGRIDADPATVQDRYEVVDDGRGGGTGSLRLACRTPPSVSLRAVHVLRRDAAQADAPFRAIFAPALTFDAARGEIRLEGLPVAPMDVALLAAGCRPAMLRGIMPAERPLDPTAAVELLADDAVLSGSISNEGLVPGARIRVRAVPSLLDALAAPVEGLVFAQDVEGEGAVLPAAPGDEDPLAGHGRPPPPRRSRRPPRTARPSAG